VLVSCMKRAVRTRFTDHLLGCGAPSPGCTTGDGVPLSTSRGRFAIERNQRAFTVAL
jgi:hypothetical protein